MSAVSQDMELCDVHLHIMPPHFIASGEDFQMPTCENAHNVISIMEKCGLKKVNIPAISVCSPVNLVSNILALYSKTISPGRVFALASLVYGYREEENIYIAEQAEDLLKAGFDGFKFLFKPNVRKQLKFAINNPIFNSFYELAQDKQYPILMHVGDPATFWRRNEVPRWAFNKGWYYGDKKEIPSLEQMYNEIFDVLVRYPYLKLTFAHFLFMSSDYERVGRLLDRFKNIMLDVTPGIEMYLDFANKPGETKEFFARYSDRILFGTDNVGVNGSLTAQNVERSKNKIDFMRTFFETEEEIEIEGSKAHGIGLPKDVCEKLYSRNFYNFLGRNSPATVDIERASSLCRSYRKYMPEDSDHCKKAVNLLDELDSKFHGKR